MRFLIHWRLFEAKDLPLKDQIVVTIDDDEYSFTVEDLYKLISEKGYPIQRIPLSEISSEWDDLDSNIISPEFKDLSPKQRLDLIKRERERINRANLKYPIVLCKGDEWVILDGNHRVSKAKNDGKSTIQSYIIPKEDLNIFKI